MEVINSNVWSLHLGVFDVASFNSGVAGIPKIKILRNIQQDANMFVTLHRKHQYSII